MDISLMYVAGQLMTLDTKPNTALLDRDWSADDGFFRLALAFVVITLILGALGFAA